MIHRTDKGWVTKQIFITNTGCRFIILSLFPPPSLHTHTPTLCLQRVEEPVFYKRKMSCCLSRIMKLRTTRYPFFLVFLFLGCLCTDPSCFASNPSHPRFHHLLYLFGSTFGRGRGFRVGVKKSRAALLPLPLFPRRTTESWGLKNLPYVSRPASRHSVSASVESETFAFYYCYFF